MKARASNLAFALSAVALCSCGPLVKIGDSGPSPTRYALTLEPTDTKTPVHFPGVRIEDFDAPAELASERIVVRTGAQEVRYAKAARWTDRPSRLLRQMVADSMKTLSNGDVVTPALQNIATPLRLTGQLKAFQILIDNTTQAQVILDAQLISNACSRILMHQTFSKTVAADSDAPRDMAAALSHAANLVSSETAAWALGAGTDVERVAKNCNHDG